MAQGQWAHFQLPMVTGQQLLIGTSGTGDVDLYIRFGAAPTLDAVDDRSWTSDSDKTLDFTASSDGVLFISVYGYAAGNFELTTLDPN